MRENTKRGLRQKIRNGVWPGWAPLGYSNNLKTKGIDIDPNKASKLRKVFELYATGNQTLYSLANWCDQNQLRGKLEKKISVSNIHSILQNIFYIGLMKYNGEIFEGTHEPIISKKLFDKVKEILHERSKPQQKEKKNNFAFLGLAKCGSCGCSITAEKQKGHNYYRCTKKKGFCQEKYIREEALIEQIKKFLQKISLPSHDMEKILLELDKNEEQAKEEAKITAQNLRLELGDIETKLGKLLDAYLGEVISAGEYKPRKEKLLVQKVELVDKIKDFEQEGLSWLEPAREFIKSLNQAITLIETENLSEITTFLKNIGSNHILQNRQFNFSSKIPYDLVAKRSEATSKNLQFSDWLRGEDSNLQPSP